MSDPKELRDLSLLLREFMGGAAYPGPEIGKVTPYGVPVAMMDYEQAKAEAERKKYKDGTRSRNRKKIRELMRWFLSQSK